MGKASRWFRALLGMKQPDPNPNSKHPRDNKRRWSFVKSYREKSTPTTTTNTKQPPFQPPQSRNNYDTPTSSSYSHGDVSGDDANKHAIAVAAATAAVAEAAVAAAQAAAAVVRLTNSGRSNISSGNVHTTAQISSSAIVIQSHFRGYLARRALRALKGLVKLQALVRGHIMRKKTAETMRCMQAMLRAQARARTVRAFIPESPYASTSKSCPILHPVPPTPEKFEQVVRVKSIKQDQSPKIKRNSSKSSSRLNSMSQDRSNFGSSWSDPRTDEPTWDPRGVISSTRTCLTDENDRADKILEIDTGKPFRRRRLFETSYSGLLTSDQLSYTLTTSKDSTTHQSPVSSEVVQSLKSILLPKEIDDNNSYCTAENSPQYCSATSQGGSSKKGPFTPTKSDGSRSLLSGYSDCPSYMAYTESSRAKMRSLSAPKQRPQYERISSNKIYSGHGVGEYNPRSNAHRVSSMHASFTSKAYPGSGRLDRLGMPVRDSTVVYYSGYLN